MSTEATFSTAITEVSTNETSGGSRQINPGYPRAFSDGSRNLERWSSDVDDTYASTPSSNYHITPTGGRFSS
ncbi:hypothetical protein TNCV_473871 [Trichonephila clavipes]|nr:hypothetical protein TNCV_473871 [Trichonephila clavipes]